uniref:Uncharacterized protein n=1 Tax=Leersia perrieri TaxID=77586 RepID=A0A0D9VVU5_9ORYZ
MAPPHQLSTFGWPASAFVAAVLARLISKGLTLIADLDDTAVGHLRRLEALLAAVWRVLDAADAGAIDVSQRPLHDLLDAAYSADDALDDLMARGGAGEDHLTVDDGTGAAAAARKPRSPLRFLFCFSPTRNSVAGSSSGGGGHGKSSKGKKISSSSSSSLDLRGLEIAFEMMAQAAYRCTTAYEHVVPGKNYATMVSVSAQAETETDAADQDQFQGDIFGRETEVEQIMEMVRFSDEDPHYRLGIGVLPIVGVEGVGKTALARFVFDHEIVEADFPVRMWVHVSGEVRVKEELMVQMIHGVVRDGHGPEVEDIRELLLQELTGKRFLLVLDNVSDADNIQWNDLIRLLQPAARRSLIMVTTQSEVAAKSVGTMPALMLTPLDLEVYERMFKHLAFDSTDESEECTPLGGEWDDIEEDGDEEEKSPMETIASELAKKMGGLPLPATAIARALFFRQEDEDHWKDVVEDKIWEQQDVAGISPALWLSYRHLDPRLKQCFVYSAVFPGSHVFSKDELVQMWVAQGLIYSEDAAARPEDIGSVFFDGLVERCFFQHVGGSRYVMHDSMRKLAQAVSTDQFFMVTESSGKVPVEVRHLTITTNNLSKLKSDLALNIPHSSGSDQHLLYRVRTIMFFADFSNSDEFIELLADIFYTAKSVRVLGLIYANIKYLPAEISLLQQLRYLNLFGNQIADLPDSVCNLYLLQVLDVRCSSPYLSPPNGITNLIHLRHLHASAPFLSGITKIQNLSHLQALEGYNVSSNSSINNLRGMTQLRGTLCLKDLHHVDLSEIRKDILKGMQHLKRLELSWCSDGKSREISIDEDTLECLQPHQNIKDLRITGYGGIKCPSWMLKTTCSLLNVTSMFLTNSVNMKNLPPFHILPCLEILELRRMHSVNKVNIVPQRADQIMFPKLKRLVFEDMFNCTEWSTGSLKTKNIVFHCLCEIHIRNCPKLRNFPDLPLALKTLIVQNVGLETLPRIHDRHSSSSTSDAMETSKEGRWTSRLTTLQIHQCDSLNSLGSSLFQQQNLLRSLEVLSIKNCDNITCDLSDGFQDLTALTDLSLYDCPKLLIDKFHTSLRKLEISECFIAQGAWVDDYPFLFSVWTLKITSCSHVSTDQESRIEPLDWLNCLFNVCNLQLENTLHLKLSMFDRLRSLEILEIDGSQSFFDDLVQEFEWLVKLQAMSIRNCKELCSLPENFCALPALEELCIENCPALEALPESGLPTSLKRLSISKCSPRLTQQCLDDELNRPKIEKIAVIYIDGKCISIQQK